MSYLPDFTKFNLFFIQLRKNIPSHLSPGISFCFKLAIKNLTSSLGMINDWLNLYITKQVGVKNCRYDKGTPEQGTPEEVLGYFTFRYKLLTSKLK